MKKLASWVDNPLSNYFADQVKTAIGEQARLLVLAESSRDIALKREVQANMNEIALRAIAAGYPDPAWLAEMVLGDETGGAV